MLESAATAGNNEEKEQAKPVDEHADDTDTLVAADNTKSASDNIDARNDEKALTSALKQKGDLRLMWLWICGGVILAISVGLLIHGLASHAAPTQAKILRGRQATMSVMDLTIKPRNDVRNFQFATLTNGVQVLTVRDTRALQKAFATAVQAGSFDDPVKLPGLAHFCEHMLFLGTKKYTDPSGFDNFMSAHGGFNNAYTSDELTVYFASVSQDAAAEGLDRFADFFNAPLFSDRYVDKEVHAIDSEHAKNVQNPSRQVMGVLYSLAAENSPMSRFHTGDLHTLSIDPKNAQPPINPVEALKEYWKTHYCPGRMKVVSVGSETNAEQLKLIQEHYGGLQAQSTACEMPRQKFDVPNPWPPEQMQKWVTIQGMLPRSFLWLQFPLPDVTSKYTSEPLDYIEYVMTYGGENSLSKVLTDSLGLGSGMEISFDTSSAGTLMFIIVQLTEQGRKNTELVLDVIFAYLAMLRRADVHESLYDSLATVQKLKWDWGGQGDPAETAEDMAERMTRVKPRDLLWADSIIELPDPRLVRSLLEKLTPTNMNVAFVKESSKAEEASSDTFQGLKVQTLQHYGIKYAVQNTSEVLDKSATSKWTEWLDDKSVNATSIERSIADLVKRGQVPVIPNAVLVPKCPGKIEGIPHALTFKHVHAAFSPYSNKEAVDTLLYGPTPDQLDLRRSSDSPYAKDPEVWYRSGWMMLSPKVSLTLSLRPLKTPTEPEMNTLQDLQLDLYGRLLGEEMTSRLVDITATGMSYEIGVGSSGVDFGFVGFAPSMHTLITKVLAEFNAFNKDPSLTPQVRWDRHLHQLREDLNTYSGLPITYAVADRNLLLTKGPHSRAEMLTALDKSEVTLKSVATCVSELLLSRQLHLTALAMGNMAEDEARTMIGDFLHNIESPSHVSMASEGGQVERLSPIVNIKKPVEVRKLNPRLGDKNDVAIVSVIVGVSTVESRVSLRLLGQILGTVAYNELRTNQQLGYIANGGEVQLSNVQLLSCAVEGDRLDADAMEASIHYVLTDLMPRRLKDLTDKEFTSYKHSLRQELLQPPLTVGDEFGHFTGPVDQGGIGFDLRNEMLKYLAGPLATKDTLNKEWKRIVLPKEGARKVVAVKYFANKDKAAASRSLEQAQKLWLEHKVPPGARVLLEREFNTTEHLTKVDSEERKKLAQSGGWFPTEQNLKLKDQNAASKEPLEVPQQIKDLIKKRKEEIDAFVDTPVEYTTTDLTKNKKRQSGGDSHHMRSVSMAPGASFLLAPGGS